MVGYVGTYSQGQSEGIYSFEISETTGVLSNQRLFSRLNNVRYMEFSNDVLFCVCDLEDGAGVVALDREGEIIDFLCYEDIGSCYIAVKDKKVYTANFHSGAITVLDFSNNLFRLIKKITIEKECGAHQILFYKDKILVPCRNKDALYIFNEQLELCNSIAFPIRSGPRHGVFSADLKKLYIVGEFSNEVFAFSVLENVEENIAFEHEWKTSILYDGKTGQEGSAAIRILKNEKTIWVSTRGENVLSALMVNENGSVSGVKIYSSEGKHPRDIVSVCNDKYLLVVNKDSNELLSFSLSENKIEKIHSVCIPEGICIAMAIEK